MDAFSISLLAVSLSMDAFSIAAITGFASRNLCLRDALRMPVSFGSFHFLMPALGWFLGSTVVGLISNYDHWVAFLLLAIVGGKMIHGAFDHSKAEAINMLGGSSLLMLSVAVSIDSLAVGLAFYLEKVPMLIPVVAISLTAFTLTTIGFSLGTKVSRKTSKSMMFVGGLVLTGMGLRIVITHML